MELKQRLRTLLKSGWTIGKSSNGPVLIPKIVYEYSEDYLDNHAYLVEEIESLPDSDFAELIDQYRAY